MSMALTRFGANDPSLPAALLSLPSALSRDPIRVRRAPKVGRRLPRREAMRARAAMALAAQDDVP